MIDGHSSKAGRPVAALYVSVATGLPAGAVQLVAGVLRRRWAQEQ
ncbi:hypothetical protein Q5425_33930 [Amycolatopsis sp. A133]|nr:hypothetical protein [Amycolatopsis sp. A133]MDQ7808762.1 hypothetical protein [Amycolatopsis sp. A133]